MLRKFAELTCMNEEVTYSELIGMTAFTGIPADLCETVADNVETYNSYRGRGWDVDKAAVLTLADTEGFYLEEMLRGFKCADSMREVLSLCELGVNFKGASLSCDAPDLSKALIKPFKKWADSLVKIGFSKTSGDFDPEFNPDNWGATMFYAISHRVEIKDKIDQYKKREDL